MNLLIVYAHPEPRSLNGALRDRMVATLTAAGHEVLVSDLYAQGWKAALDRADFPAEPEGAPLGVIDASHRAFAHGTQTPDVAEEQRRLLWADAVILQFPLWWFSMPAILKGWVERVFAHGFAYGVGEHSDRRWGDRYGEGVIDVNYSCRSATTIFAGRSQVLPLVAVPLRPPRSRSCSCRHLRRSCRRVPRPAPAASSRTSSSCSCRSVGLTFPRAHAIEASAARPQWRRGAPTRPRAPTAVPARHGHSVHPPSFATRIARPPAPTPSKPRPCAPRGGTVPDAPRAPTPSQRIAAVSLIPRPRCSSCLRCASSPPLPARSFARSR
ncbi:NAD(P)H-dependent oxidoreductase [Sorangium sp. So ce131]